jgi:CubicO group peptidase (beta-lactamase class C family)
MNAHFSRLFLSVTLIVAVALGLLPSVQAQQVSTPDYWPTEGWRTSTPEEQGMDSEKLLEILGRVNTTGFHSLLVIRHGYVVLDASTYPFSVSQPHWMSWVTKSIVSTLIGIAIDQGHIESVDQSIWDFFPKESTANMDADKEAITLAHLLSLTPGMRDSGIGAIYHLTADGQSWVQFALDQPMQSPPGEEFLYGDSNAHLVSAILQQATGMSAAEYARQNLFEPLGITNVTWWADPQGVNWGGDGVAWSAYDLAKLGYLYSHHGEWDGQQIVPSAWIETATSLIVEQTGLGASYGYSWWNGMCGPGVKYPCYGALGFGSGVSLWVVPDLDLIVVMTGYNGDGVIVGSLFVPAVQSDSALAPNPAAQEKLQAKVDALANPVPAAVPAPPDIQAQVSGQTYALDENDLGWTSLTITFGEQEALLTLDVQGRRLEFPVGLDKIFRVSSDGLPGDVPLKRPVPDVPLALKGAWKGETFVITARDVLGTLDAPISLVFKDKNTLRITTSQGNLETVGLPNVSIQGKLQ